MFFTYPDIPKDTLPPEKVARIEAIAADLPNAEVVEIRRQVVKLHLPTLNTTLEGDVTQSGLTIYLGGFDWGTFQTPPQVLQQFPEYLPLPHQVIPEEM